MTERILYLLRRNAEKLNNVNERFSRLTGILNDLEEEAADMESIISDVYQEIEKELSKNTLSLTKCKICKETYITGRDHEC